MALAQEMRFALLELASMYHRDRSAKEQGIKLSRIRPTDCLAGLVPHRRRSCAQHAAAEGAFVVRGALGLRQPAPRNHRDRKGAPVERAFNEAFTAWGVGENLAGLPS